MCPSALTNPIPQSLLARSTVAINQHDNIMHNDTNRGSEFMTDDGLVLCKALHSRKMVMHIFGDSTSRGFLR